jgi:hypothetical protein
MEHNQSYEALMSQWFLLITGGMLSGIRVAYHDATHTNVRQDR